MNAGRFCSGRRNYRLDGVLPDQGRIDILVTSQPAEYRRAGRKISREADFPISPSSYVRQDAKAQRKEKTGIAAKERKEREAAVK
jgi:hypothetical protein